MPKGAKGQSEKQKDRQVKSALKKEKMKVKGGDAYKKSWNSFVEQLAAFNLRPRDVSGDGNCLFRAVADQLEGKEATHLKMRETVVDYMLKESDDFSPFVEEDFKGYCAKMKKNGEWGGNLELAAISRCYNLHIVVHQLAAPRLEVINCEDPKRTIHISYHEGEHYASVRHKDDPGTGPATTFELLKVEKKAGGAAKPAGEGPPPTKNELIVMQSTQCHNLTHVRNVLREVYDDPDAATEILISEKMSGIDWDNLPTEAEVEAQVEQASAAAAAGLPPPPPPPPAAAAAAAAVAVAAVPGAAVKKDAKTKVKGDCKDVKGKPKEKKEKQAKEPPDIKSKPKKGASSSSAAVEEEAPAKGKRGQQHLTNKQRKEQAQKNKAKEPKGKDRVKEKRNDAAEALAAADFGSVQI